MSRLSEADWISLNLEAQKNIVRKYWNDLENKNNDKDFDEVLARFVKDNNSSEEKILYEYYLLVTGPRDEKFARLFTAFHAGKFNYDVGTGKITRKGDNNAIN